MKLVLVQPPIQDFYDTPIRLQPLGLAYLKAAVKKHLPEVEVVIKDFHHGWGRRTLVLPGELAYLKEFYTFPDQSPFSLFHHFYHFGASFETIAREVTDEKPDMVGISSLFSPYYREALRSAEAIKGKIHSPIVLGGPHVSAVPELMLGNPAVDWVIRGEGERPLVELIKAWQSGKGWEQVPGLGYKQEGGLVFNPPGDPFPIEELPLPDFSDFDQGTYCYEKHPMSFVITSRGCPHHCSFCSVHGTFSGYRKRTARDVFEEMKCRYQEGYRVFDFEDDNLTYDREEMINLCRKIRQGFPPGDIELLAMNGISYQSLDRELLQWMREAGFSHLNLSLVTSNPAVRKETLRFQRTEKYLRVVREASRLGFKIVSYQILGLPGESLASMLRTLRLNCRLPVLLGASPFYLTPGTTISQRFPEQTEKDIFQSRLTALGLETGPFKREDIYTLFVATRIINFFKGLRFDGDTINLEDALETARNQGKKSAIGAELFEKLFLEGRLFAATREGHKPLSMFRDGLFFDFWSRLDHIITQEGKKIKITPR
jgi:radical SAM superfamily enzyme YgiQ (UPF0313 family)